jgi:Uma2 family endonuclease
MRFARTALVTQPEDLFRIPDGDDYELIGGQLATRNKSGRSALAATVLTSELVGFEKDRALGLVFSSRLQYRCFADRDRIRRVDASFIELSRFRSEMWHGFVPIAPALAVDVVTEDDRYVDIESRRIDFLSASGRLYWIVEPLLQRAMVYRANGSIQVVRPDDSLKGEDVLPGFSISLAAVLETPLARTD